MMSLSFTLYLFVFIFAAIGMTRGWAKEMLVTMSLFVAMLLIGFLQEYIPQIKELPADSVNLLYLRVGALLTFAAVGYQTVRLSPLQVKLERTHPYDALLGIVAGAINGYLIFGCVWFFMAQANYPFPEFIAAPVAGTVMGDSAAWWMKFLPPSWAFYSNPWLTAIVIVCCFVLLWII